MKVKLLYVAAIVFSLLMLIRIGMATAQAPGPHAPASSQAEPGVAASSPVSAAFTYQGQLKKGGAPVTANCSMAFRLYDQASGGSQVGSTVASEVPVLNGLFTVQLNFGDAAFSGDARWLGIQVQCPGDSGYVDLGRQTVVAAPYALTLRPGALISGSIYDGAVLQVYNTDPSPGGGGYAISAINNSGYTWRPAIYGENRGASAGVYGRSDGWHAVVGWNQSNAWAGVWGNNTAGGPGVAGNSTSGFGVEASGAGDGSSSDTLGDVRLGGDRGEVFANGTVLDLFSNGHVWIDLDDDNNGSHAFTIWNGTNSLVFTVDENGNMTASGTKSGRVQTANYGQRLLYAMESPEVWFEDIGAAVLANGVARLTFDPMFAEAANLKTDYHVFVTPICEEPVVLFVSDKTANGFSVQGVTLSNQPSDCAFDYRVIAKRLGYEQTRLAAVGPDENSRRTK